MNLSIGRKLGLSFGAVFALMIASAVFCYYKLGELSAAQADLVDTRTPIVLTNYDIRTANNRVTTAIFEYLLLGDDPARREALSKEIKTTWDRLNEDIANLEKMADRFHRDEDRTKLQTLKTQMASYQALQDQIVRQSYSGNKNAHEEAVAVLKAKGTPMSLEIRRLARDLTAQAGKDVEAQTAVMSGARKATVSALGFGSLFACILGIGLAAYVSKCMVHCLHSVVDRAQLVAHGDLSAGELRPESHDEIAELVKAVNEMQEQLRQTLESISTTAEQIASASEELSANAAQASEGGQRQSDQTSQAATAMQEMSATITQMSEHSRDAADAATKTSNAAEQGGKEVREALTLMQEIAASTHDVGDKIGELGKQSERIGSILGVIEDIADQTDMLALNAAIEAARAGEQGRGFAVVADEVRKLAEKTTSATKEISQMIAAIRSGTESAIGAVERESSKVQEGVTKTGVAGKALQDIIGNIERVNGMIAQIATAVTQQSAASEQISRSMDEIAKVVKASSEGAKHSAQACDDLSNMALNLEQLVSHFQVRRGGGEGRVHNKRSTLAQVAAASQASAQAASVHA